MKFNPTSLEFLIFLLTCLSLYVWLKYGRRIRRWLQDYFRVPVAFAAGYKTISAYPKKPVTCKNYTPLYTTRETSPILTISMVLIESRLNPN